MLIVDILVKCVLFPAKWLVSRRMKTYALEPGKHLVKIVKAF